MSGLGDAEFVIGIDTSQLVSGSNAAKQTFQEMSDAGLQSMQTVQTEVDRTSTGLQKIPAAIEPVKTSFTSLIGPVTGLAASAASLYFSFDQLELSSIRVEQAHLRVQKAQDAVNKLIDEGKQGTDQYSQAMQNLSIQQERYDTSQNMVNQNLVFMGLNMVTLGTSTIPSVIKAVQSLQITQEGFAVALEATMPWLLAITAALLAWEDVITPLIKQHYNLDLGIQDNIQKMVSQHSQVTTNIGSFNDLSGTMGAVDESIGGTSSSFDTLGTSISGVTGKLSDMEQAFQDLKNTGSFSTQGTSILSQNDVFTQTMAQINQVKSIENDIQTLMDNHVDKQTAINEVMDHYMTLLQEEAFNLGESNDQLQKKIQLLQQAGVEAEKLVDIQKKANAVTTNAFGIPDSSFNSITAGLAQHLGLTQDEVIASFSPGGAGSAFNPGLQTQWEQGIRDFGSMWEMMNQGLSRNLPNQESVGNVEFNTGGINTSTSSGILHNDDVRNFLVTLIANVHMFGENYGLDKDFLRQAVDDGYAQQQAIFEQNSSQWQMFYALKAAGLFTGDPTLSMEDNLTNAQTAYEAIFTGLRPDVASALEAANEQSYSYMLGADARSPGVLVTHYQYEIPTEDALKYAKADSVFATEQLFQSVLSKAKSTLGLTQKQIIASLANPLTVNDVQDELDFQSRLAAMSSGA